MQVGGSYVGASRSVLLHLGYAPVDKNVWLMVCQFYIEHHDPDLEWDDLAWTNFNPGNVTLVDEPCESTNSDGVMRYFSPEQGAAAVAAVLKSNYYPNIYKTLINNAEPDWSLLIPEYDTWGTGGDLMQQVWQRLTSEGLQVMSPIV